MSDDVNSMIIANPMIITWPNWSRAVEWSNTEIKKSVIKRILEAFRALNENPLAFTYINEAIKLFIALKKHKCPWPELSVIETHIRELKVSEYYILDVCMQYKFCEKPSYFKDIDKPQFHIPKTDIPLINIALGRQLKTVFIEDVLEPAGIIKPGGRLVHGKLTGGIGLFWGPMSAMDPFEQLEPTTIMVAHDDDQGNKEYKKGDMFLANKWGAKTYLRMWAKLV